MTLSIPILRVKRLKPTFVRQHHLGPVTTKQAIKRINADADLSRLRQVTALQGRG